MSTLVSSHTLYDGMQMPVVGLGTSMGISSPTPEDLEAFITAYKSALDLGYRHFDTASSYNTEETLGSAIAAKIQEGIVKREDLFVTTKLWVHEMKPGKVVPALRESLKKLKLDYVDNYLIHWPVALMPGSPVKPGECEVDESVNLVDTWRDMEECKRLGLARTIGVSNFNRSQLQNIMEHCDVKPSNNQTELHVYLQCKKLVAFCKEHAIAVVCYSPLLQQKPRQGLDMASDPALTAVAEKHGCSNQQVALRFLVQEGLVVIPKSANPQHQKENINIFNFELSDDAMNTLRNLDKNARAPGIEEYIAHAKEYPFNEEY